MKRSHYILVLFFISTGYLFSQFEENKIIKMDTIIRIDTIVRIIKIDTVVIEKRINEPEKEIERYYLYNDYLEYMKKNSLDYIKITEFTNSDTLAVKTEEIGIVLAEGGILFSLLGKIDRSPPHISLSVKIPISNNWHFIPKYSGAISNDKYHLLSFMWGKYFALDKNNKFLIEGASGFSFLALMVMIPVNVNLYYRVSKYTLLSLGIEFLPVHPSAPCAVSLGLGFTY